MKKPIAMLCLISSLSACAPGQVVDTVAAAGAIMTTDRAFAELSAQTNPKHAFATYMAPNGMMLPRGSEGAIEGLQNVMLTFGEADDPGYRLLWQPQFAEAAAAGDMGWSWGQYQVEVAGAVVQTGKYLNVWQRQADGSWKVRVDIGNQRPPKEPSN